MKFPKVQPEPLPPALSMDEYADLVEELLLEADPVKTARQKAMEERIVAPFRIVADSLHPPRCGKGARE